MDGLRTWIEIDAAALHHNYHVFKKHIAARCRIMAVVKSNAYGHGLLEAAAVLQDAGVDCFAVDSIVEAMTLRQDGHVFSDILVLGHTLKERLEDAAAHDIMVTIAGMTDLENLQKSGLHHFDEPLRIHMKIDTGMHRQGFSLSELPRALTVLKSLDVHIHLEGLYTHLAAADDPKHYTKTKLQLDRFAVAGRMARDAGFFADFVHAVATSGTFAHPEACFDMVRIGIGLYGYVPDPTSPLVPRRPLKPVLSWKTIIAEVKEIPKGDSIGYGFTETMKRESRVALLPVGYWHGYRRSLSSVARALVRGRFAKVLGRVSMDMMSVDVTDIPDAKPGDIATLIGQDGGCEISAHELAHLSGTTVYEILTCINSRIKRVVIDSPS